jgi:hypothetical protein
MTTLVIASPAKQGVAIQAYRTIQPKKPPA